MQEQLNFELCHQVWLTCMQMANCQQGKAVLFLQKYNGFMNVALTSSAQTLFMLACSIGSVNLVRQSLKYSPTPNQKDHFGRTSLHYAASVGNLQIFELLISSSWSALEETIGRETPLSKACLFSQGGIIEWYLNNQVKAFEMMDALGRKPLQILKINGEELYNEVVEIYGQMKMQ